MRNTEDELYSLHARMCRVFTDPTRLKILRFLGKGEKNVGELAKLCKTRQATLSQHLAIMRREGVLKTRRKGTSIFYSVADGRILEACSIMRKALTSRLKNDGKISKVIL